MEIEGVRKAAPDGTNLALAEWFVREVNQSAANIENKVAKSIKTIERLISGGWALEDIQEEIMKFAKEYPSMVTRIYHLEEIFVNKQPPDNIMQPDVFYYHNILREVPPPVRMRMDPETGQMIRHSEPFFLEMKRRFTMKELMDYWYTSCQITPHDHMKRQDEGKFKHFLGIYGLDEILFAIDVSKSSRAEMNLSPLRNAFDLERYMDKALEFIREKENTHKQVGINRVIRRKDQA
ncbi:hypothetical protein GZH47_33755 (plasmid) [Paenibacillus rhizovicinus]|uniref:Uncharacterized protein n=1 Tax=Paenibacillus rhizovicinus TaxID=2704463 RepID=A0A6C0PBM8_9BACL|nr:hypothetical protein [Paenibacillus rhizovicinus]QHW35859.1 hypothetical protein GZH47_33755 [Paenibacillus rhizovicinus]